LPIDPLPAIRDFSRYVLKQSKICRKLVLLFDQKLLKDRPFGRISLKPELVTRAVYVVPSYAAIQWSTPAPSPVSFYRQGLRSGKIPLQSLMGYATLRSVGREAVRLFKIISRDGNDLARVSVRYGPLLGILSALLASTAITMLATDKWRVYAAM
jgi:hypothetical protein